MISSKWLYVISLVAILESLRYREELQLKFITMTLLVVAIATEILNSPSNKQTLKVLKHINETHTNNTICIIQVLLHNFNIRIFPRLGQTHSIVEYLKRPTWHLIEENVPNIMCLGLLWYHFDDICPYFINA